MKNKLFKFLKRRIAWYLLKGFMILNGIFPLCLSYFMGKGLGSLAYNTILRHRKIALDSLSVAFPEKSLKEKKRIARDFFIFMAQSAFELLNVLKNIRYLKNTRIQGSEHLDKALEKGKGVMFLTAHLGNFPLLSLKLAREGYPITIVVRQMRDESANKYFQDLRERGGVKTIFSHPRGECIKRIIKALRSNEVVVMLMDQNFGSGGVWVKFFGKLAATPVGPIVLAARAGSTIIPAYIHKEDDYKYCVKIFPEEELIKVENKDEAILLNAIKFTRLIESWIRNSPYQWGWIHRRWKSRPSEKVRKQKFKIEQDSDFLSDNA